MNRQCSSQTVWVITRKLYNKAWDISHKVILYWFPRVTNSIGYCHWLSPITVWKTQLLMISHTGLRTNRHQSQSNWKDSNSIAFIVSKGTIQVPWVENTSIGLTCDGLCLLQYHPAKNDRHNFAILIMLFLKQLSVFSLSRCLLHKSKFHSWWRIIYQNSMTTEVIDLRV